MTIFAPLKKGVTRLSVIHHQNPMLAQKPSLQKRGQELKIPAVSYDVAKEGTLILIKVVR